MKKELLATGLAISAAVTAGCNSDPPPNHSNNSPVSATSLPPTTAEKPVQVTNLLDEALPVWTHTDSSDSSVNESRVGTIEAGQAVMAFCVDVPVSKEGPLPYSATIYVETTTGARGDVTYETPYSAKPGIRRPNEGLPQLRPDLATLQSQLPDC